MKRGSYRITRLVVRLLFLITLCTTSFIACAGHPGVERTGVTADDAALMVRVLSYNIHHGEGVDGVFDLERLARVIREVDPDLVALQEVDRATTRSSGVDQAAELGRLTGLHSVFGKTMDFAGGGYGVAILSQWPILRVEDHMLPASEDREPRAALSVTVEFGENGREIVFISTHFDHTRDPVDRKAQALRINELFSDEIGQPMILAGDLNAPPESEPIGILLEDWSDAAVGDPRPTSPSDGQARRIDYVLYRPAGIWRVVDVRVLDEEIASDHRPLLAVLELRDHR
ncbi:endonuclease/exonuclease/phosphatase family protein [Gemmatimonadota bacterium]